MPETSFRALFAELLDWTERTSSDYYKQADVILRARAALAQPEPVAPTDDELDELYFKPVAGPMVPYRRYARSVLDRWGRPASQPVSVRERLPEPEDCDRKGRCWIFDPGDHVSGPVWAFEGSEEFQWLKTQDEDKVQQASQRGRLTWLPHYALPLPTRGTH